MLTLEGISLKGKNRIREHGSLWKIVRHSESVLFASGIDWVLLESIKTGHWIWVDQKNSKHFKINA